MPTTKRSRCHRLLQWAAEDLTDPIIAADPDRLALERQTVIERLSPHIEEVVQLAWAQLQQVQSSLVAVNAKPVCGECKGRGITRVPYSLSSEYEPCWECNAASLPSSKVSATTEASDGSPDLPGGSIK